VKDGVHAVERSLDRRVLPDVAVDELGAVRNVLAAAVREIIQHCHVTDLDEFVGDVAPDEPRAAGDEH